MQWIWFPNTLGIPLEEVAALFGDADEVAIYQREIEIDVATHTIVDHHGRALSKSEAVEAAHHVEKDKGGTSTESAYK
jgi:hypothetical protein